MRRFGTILGLTMVLTMAMGPAAFAAAPEVVFDGTLTIAPEVYDFFSSVCGFEIMHEETVSVRRTVFYNEDGYVDHMRIHAQGSARYWTDTAEAFENGAINVTIGADGSVKTAGNQWNIHSGEGGVLVQDSGRVKLDALGNLVAANGRHEFLAAEMGDVSGLEDLCVALSG